MRVSKDVLKLNPHLKKKTLRSARLKPKRPPADYEQELYDQCVRFGLPAPLRQVKFAKAVGRDYAADLAWGPERIIVEVNGGTYVQGAHSTGRGLHRDYFKQNLAQLLGFRYFEFDSKMVTDYTALKVILCAFKNLNAHTQDWSDRPGRQKKERRSWRK